MDELLVDKDVQKAMLPILGRNEREKRAEEKADVYLGRLPPGVSDLGLHRQEGPAPSSCQ